MKYTATKICIGDKDYPNCLLNLKSPPKSLYYRGELKNIDFNKCLAVVGSRRITSYGRQVLDKFISDLVASGVIIVSGFMYGVDTQAHKLTVECGGRTIAVLGNGLDVVYPVENEQLYTQILENGGVVMSEYPAKHKPHLWTYPQRNRIVAAISLMGVLVVEAGENSGSLVTVKWARKLKRKIYAVPGPITSIASTGTNYILKKGLAKMVLNSNDIVKSEHKNINNDTLSEMNNLEAKIYQTLMRENFTLDELSIILNEDINKISAELSLMSLKGIIYELSGKFAVKGVR